MVDVNEMRAVGNDVIASNFLVVKITMEYIDANKQETTDQERNCARAEANESDTFI